MLTSSGIEELENNFKDSPNRSLEDNMVMAGFYIWNNTGIGLQCFSWGLLVIPGLFVLCSNALRLAQRLGTCRVSDVAAGANFFEFVTAHGPFELTAIVLSAGAGLKLACRGSLPAVSTCRCLRSRWHASIADHGSCRGHVFSSGHD